jgi:phosphoenolpyruvate-protein kinase (PTS system EI component)
MIGDMIAAARGAGRPVSVCGEMASDPEGAIVLAALGADSLSLAVDRVTAIRKLMAQIDPVSLPRLGASLLEAQTVEQVKALVRDAASARVTYPGSPPELAARHV